MTDHVHAARAPGGAPSGRRPSVGRCLLEAALRRGDPPIELSNAPGDGVYVNPQDLREGDEVLIAAALSQCLEPEAGVAGAAGRSAGLIGASGR